MIIEPKEITIRSLFQGYKNNEEDGVKGFNGELDIRPPYQREFVYNPKQQALVIDSIRKKFPINVMYWVKNSETSFEILDGQQRTLSICDYLSSGFPLNNQYFHNLTTEEKEQILDYKLTVYFCQGTDREKLDWFEIINIAGEKLTEQELRNAVYTGEWLIKAKTHFSKTRCGAFIIAEDYVIGTPIRQDYLETALKWISNDDIVGYMAKHQNDSNCNELWLYFQSVISWVKATFTNYRREMKGVNWGELYNNHKNDNLNTKDLEAKIVELMKDEDVTKKSGIYSYVLNGKERHLSIRAFNDKMKREAYEAQKGICHSCNKLFDITKMEADHIVPWSKGGRTISSNCRMLCRTCNSDKSDN